MDRPQYDAELVAEITEAVRRADEEFERVGGSSRHWVRECLLPELEAVGLEVLRRDRMPFAIEGLARALEFFEARDRMNAAVHEEEVRWSPLTETLRSASSNRALTGAERGNE